MSKVVLPTSTYDQDKPLLAPEDEAFRSQSISERHATSRVDRKRLLIAGLVLVLLSFFSLGLYKNYDLCSLVHGNSKDDPIMQSPLTGWVKRAAPHPNKDSFVADPAKLQFGLLRSMPVKQNSLVAAFFAPDFVITGDGHVLQLGEDDRSALPELASSAVAGDIPTAGGFRNQWRIKHATTSQPIHWLKVMEGGQTKEVSIYGHSSNTRELSTPVEGLTSLPEKLQEAFGVLDEGRTAKPQGGGSAELAEQVAEIVVNA